MPVFEVNSDTKSRKAIAVRFSNGAVNSQDQDRVIYKCYSQREAASKTPSKASSTSRHIVTAKVDGMTYIGKTFGQANRFPTENCDYYFGVHDKTTGKIQVISAELCQLEPLIDEKKNDFDADSSKRSYREKHDALSKDFGSGRSQRAVKKRIDNKLEDEMVSATTQAVIESRHTQQQAAESVAVSVMTETSAVPPHNKDALSPDDVYKLKDLVPPDVLESINFKSEVFNKHTQEDITKWRTEKLYSSFVLDKIENLSLREDARRLQSQCLMYLQYLINVFLMKAKDLGKKVPLPGDWPAPVKKYILKTFTLEVVEPGKRYQRCVPSRLKDLLLSHILVLCLKLSQFELPLLTLTNDLNLSHKRISTHFTILGCTIKKSKSPQGLDVYRAVLNVPLKFPEIKDKRAKNRIF
uniref:DNA-directed RNA polymerase I subunit RPA49 n=2 Tax=Arion vulgaris TaxID=1028688 RepID=A0A0B6ZW77_9EUPU